jgi:polysaccharide biosynthesis/export protein
MIAVMAALLSGCASSSAERFTALATDTDARESRVTASAQQTSAEVGTLRRDPSSNSGRSTAPVTTNSLRASATALSAIGRPGSSAYKIGPQDVVEVSVFKVPELSSTVQVSEAGTVNLPLVGEVPAAGRTARQVENELTHLLGRKYLQNPQVTVFIKEYNSQRVTIDGAVKRPGVFPIQGSMSLLQAVAMAQGLEDMADDTVIVFRDVDGVRKVARFDVSEIRTGDAKDPQLIAGDVVVAGTSTFKKGFNSFLKVLPVAGLFTLL